MYLIASNIIFLNIDRIHFEDNFFSTITIAWRLQCYKKICCGNGAAWRLNNLFLKEHYDDIVIPKLNKSTLNGIGYGPSDTKLRTVMNDFNEKASTPVHNVKDLATFKEPIWTKYCDLANFQTSELNDRIYVNPIDSCPDKYKEVFWIDQKHSFLLYDPKWYCWGLPCSNPNTIS